MEIKLENESLELTINSFGAELKSITGKERVHSICGMPMRNTGREAHRCFSRLSAA